jgi:hypothetical protein
MGIAILSPTDASVKDLRKTGFQARTFQGFQLRPECAGVLVIDEASMLSVPQMLWLVKHSRENDSRVLLVGDSAQHRSVERGDALSVLERLRPVRRVTSDRAKAGTESGDGGSESRPTPGVGRSWSTLESSKRVDDVELLRSGRDLEAFGRAKRRDDFPRHEEGRKVAAVVRRTQGGSAIGAEITRHLPPHGSRVRSVPDLLHYAPDG